MSYLPDSRVTTIVIHYSATPVERDYTVDDIDAMHRRRGFKEVGYHFFIRKDGTVETGRDLSQPGRFEMGAHSKGENDESIGICYEGGVRRSAPNVGFDSRTRAQKVAMEATILHLLERFPGAVVKGHRDMPGAATQCPGFNATEWWDEVSARRVAEQNVAQDASKGRSNPMQSTTIQAVAVASLATVGQTLEAVKGVVSQVSGALNISPEMALAVVAGCALAWIFRERLQKWAAGIK